MVKYKWNKPKSQESMSNFIYCIYCNILGLGRFYTKKGGRYKVMKNMKYPYEQADIRVILLDSFDIITTSSNNWSGEMDGGEGGGWDVN